MQPEEILTTLAELGVAVAGFSGIVVALGDRTRPPWPADRALLGVLLWASGGIVLWSLAPLILLSAELSQRTTWALSSAGWSIQQALVLSLRGYQIRRVPDQIPGAAFLVPISLGGSGALVLQVANALWWNAAWPHLVALSWWLVLSFVIFLRLMHVRDRDV